MLTSSSTPLHGDVVEINSYSRIKMNEEMQSVFDNIKPLCEILINYPSIESITTYNARVSELKKEVVQTLQQYIFLPLIRNIKSAEIRRKIELHIKVLETVRTFLERITITSRDLFLKLGAALLTVLFDANRPGMNAAEEVKYSTIRCLTVLMLNLDPDIREKLLFTHVPMLAQVVFVSVHIAKLEKLRVLRLAALHCVMAHTLTHPQLTVEHRLGEPALELAVVDRLLAGILPGLLAALQDVAVSTDNPGHAVVVAAIEAIHRILCLPMHNKYLVKKEITTEDFVNMIKDKYSKDNNTEVSSKGPKNPRDMEKRSSEWFEMAGEKLTLITKSIVVLRTHEHYKVRKEIAVYCNRIITECSTTMCESVPICLDVLISLTKDEYPEVSQYAGTSVKTYFQTATEETKNPTMDKMCDNFVILLRSLPRVLNNIDSSRKLSALNLLHGYVESLSGGCGARLSAALTSAGTAQLLCAALVEAAQHHTTHDVMHTVAHRDVTAAPPAGSPWSVLRHVEGGCARRLQAACASLGGSHHAQLLLDTMLLHFHQDRDAARAYVMNWMAAGPNSCPYMVKRILDTYLEEDVWYSSLEVDSSETAAGTEDTLDITVYNPRAWIKESVPGLYEGSVETRYTDISLAAPAPLGARSPCLRRAHKNLALCCVITEGVGVMARRLQHMFQPYLLRTLCLVLERVGSKYEYLHLAGLKAINDIAAACGHSSVCDLIRCNADYFTNQITLSLKKAWDCESALQILSVVMEYSDASMLDCLYGIVEDVLVQSCDKFYEKNINAYLQVFLTFVECIRKWFPGQSSNKVQEEPEIDLLRDLEEYVKCTQEAERLICDSESDFDRQAKSAEEMAKEDMKRREEEMLDYDDTVTTENQPLPLHIKVTISIVKRSINFIQSPQRDTSLLALRVTERGLLIVSCVEDELLPLVHATWGPLVARFSVTDAVTLRCSLDLLVTMAKVAKDFIRGRTVKEVLPSVYKFLHKSCKDSYLKDSGSAYRNSVAYTLQVRALKALPDLVVDLGLDDECLVETMKCFDPYLSNKQPKPLQAIAVNFFKTMLEYDYGATWHHLRELCNNDAVLEPVPLKYMLLQPVVGSPYEASDKDYDSNIKLIFDKA